MTKDWLLPAIFIPIVWGFWGFLPRLAVRYIEPWSAMVFQTVGMTAFGILLLFWIDFRPEYNPKGIIFAILAGIFGFAGAFLYLMAISKGKVSVVVFISALYPFITIALAYILLKEPITFKEGLGMVFACIAIILFST